MNPYLKQMIDLFHIDNELVGFDPEIERVKNEYMRIENSRNSLLQESQKIKDSIQEVNRKITGLEQNLQKMSDDNKEYEAKMKNVKKDKELNALSIENELRKEQIQYDNNEINRFNDINESLAEKLKDKEDAFAEFESQLSEAEKSMESQLETIQGSKKRIYKEREDLVLTMDKKTHSFYGKIRRWAKETAAVPVKDSACYGCYMKLNDQTYLEVLKSDDIITCPNCGRLLYFLPEDEVDAQ